MIHHPCEFTTIQPQSIGPINFSVFDAFATFGTIYNIFSDFSDVKGVFYSQPTTLCGPRSYSVSIGTNP